MMRAYAREILRAIGTPPVAPTLIGTDNRANQLVGSGAACPSRSKHFLRRYHSLLRRVQEGECVIKHVPDADMPADFLTKWIDNKKLDRSINYVTNNHTVADSAPPGVTLGGVSDRVPS